MPGLEHLAAPFQVVQGILDLVAGKPLLDQDVDDLLDPRLAAGLAGEGPDGLLYRPDDVALRLCDPRHNLVDIKTPALRIVCDLPAGMPGAGGERLERERLLSAS